MEGADTWILFALLFGLSMAVVNILDKLVVDRWASRPIVPVLLLGVFNVFPAALILWVKGMPYLSLRLWLMVLAAGAALLSMALFYFSAAAREEISRVVPLMFLSPLFVAILAWIFLGEVFSLLQYAGIAALIGGAVLVSVRFPYRFTPGRAFWNMILAAFSISVYFTIMKYLLRDWDYWSVFSLTRLGMSGLMVPLFFLYYADLRDTLRKFGGRVVGIMALDQNIALAANLFLTVAAAAGPITLVNALASTQPFFVLFFTVLLSRFIPSLLWEESRGSTVLQKMAALCLMFAGALLIT